MKELTKKKLKFLAKILGIVVGIVIILLIVSETLQFFVWWKIPPFTSINYDKYYSLALAENDPTKCNRLAAGLADGTPRASCYFHTVVSMGEIELCDEYKKELSPVSVDGSYCKLKIALNKKIRLFARVIIVFPRLQLN
jgi:hypothetical protein